MLACRGGSCCHFVMFTFTGLVLWLCPIITIADDTTNDPKSWADSFIRLVAARDAEGIVNALAKAPGVKYKAEDVKLKLAQLPELLPRMGEISATDLIAQREWGKSLVMYWYYLDFKNKALITSLRFQKHGDGWQLNQFNFDTDIDQAKLP